MNKCPFCAADIAPRTSKCLACGRSAGTELMDGQHEVAEKTPDGDRRVTRKTLKLWFKAYDEYQARRGESCSGGKLRLALNADTTPLSLSDRLVFKSLEERACEAAQAGYSAVSVDCSEPGLTPSKAGKILGKYGLSVASGFFHGHFHDPAKEGALYREAVRQAEFSKELGQTHLFVSAFVSPPERHAIAGRVQPDEPVSLNRNEFRQMAHLLNRIGSLWREDGITLCFHPHVATYVEAPHEVELLMEETDPKLVKFGPDTGHILFGGGEPLEMIRRYYDRLGALHIKDVLQGIVQKARSQRMDYRRACGAGVWTEIGTGDIDFRSLFRFLQDQHWSGWVIVETDHTSLPTALESSRVSRQYLRDEFGL